jgi:hypothetical protein
MRQLGTRARVIAITTVTNIIAAADIITAINRGTMARVPRLTPVLMQAMPPLRTRLLRMAPPKP